MTQTQRNTIVRTVTELVRNTHIYGHKLALADETDLPMLHEMYNSIVNPLWKELSNVLNEMEKEGK